jgi:MFS family permease
MQSSRPHEVEHPDWFAFWRLVLIQAQNSFSEKGAQFLLIPLGVWLAGEKGNLEYPLGAIIVLPFVLFSPLAGWFSDRFCKTAIIRTMALIQFIVLVGMFWCLRTQQLDGALAWFCVFAIQATFFSPAKKGIVKDMVGSAHIGFASGIVEMASVLALLIGQLGVFLWFSYLLDPSTDSIWRHLLGSNFFHHFDAWFHPADLPIGWYAASFPCFVFLILSFFNLVATWTLPSYEPYPTRPFSWALLVEHLGQLKYLWSQKILRQCEVGICYFWFFGGTVVLMTIQLAKQVTRGGDDFGTEGAWLMAWISGGMVLGGIIASLVCSGAIKMKVSVVGGAGMTLGCLGLAIASPSSWIFYVLLIFSGAMAAAFLVPLNACLQNQADNDRRGDVIAAGNLVDCVLGLIAVGFQYAMMLVLPPSYQFVVMGLMCLAMTFYVSRNLVTRPTSC